GSQQDIFEITFINDQTGFIVGEQSTILKTTNGGTTWYDVSSGLPINTTFVSISFPTQSVGYIGGHKGSGNNILIKTTDSGESWTVIDEWLPYILDLQFVTPDSGILVTYLSSSLRTMDGGQTWEELDPYFSSMRLYFADQNTGYFVYGDDDGGMDSPVIIKTIDFCNTNEVLTDYVTLEFL
ncbi:MAG: YCF48-related protein, partial [Bacteroidota bacterium]